MGTTGSSLNRRVELKNLNNLPALEQARVEVRAGADAPAAGPPAAGPAAGPLAANSSNVAPVKKRLRHDTPAPDTAKRGRSTVDCDTCCYPCTDEDQLQGCDVPACRSGAYCTDCSRSAIRLRLAMIISSTLLSRTNVACLHVRVLQLHSVYELHRQGRGNVVPECRLPQATLDRAVQMSPLQVSDYQYGTILHYC